MEQTTSCQIQGLNKNLWLRFRQMALSEGVSASAKIRAMVEEVVAGQYGEQSNHATDISNQVSKNMEKRQANER